MDHPKKLHTYAAQIAKQLKKHQPPPFHEEMIAYLDNHPELVMESLGGIVERLQAGEANGSSLIEAYLFLIGVQLEHIRYRIDRNYDWAKGLIAQFQQEVVNLVHEGRLPDTLLAQIAIAMREAKLEPDPQLFAAMTEAMEAQEVPQAEPPDVNELLEVFAQQIEGDEFEVMRTITEFTYAMPTAVRVALTAAMIDSRLPNLQDAVPLWVLDDRKDVRQGIARVLLESVDKLTPTGLRRLIAIRSWLPEDEQPLIDEVIKTARKKAVECAQWPADGHAEVHSSAIDGSGAQGFLILSKAGKKYILSSILLRLHIGILDAWSNKEPQSKRALTQQLSTAAEKTALQAVSRGYLDRAVQHHLAVGRQNGRVPMPGLLEVAEVLEATDWRPARLDPELTIESLFQELPEALRHPEAIERCLKQSDVWSIYSGITQSWFEDDQEVANLLAKSQAHRFDTLTQRIVTDIIEPRRTKWMQQLLWAALWLKEVSDPDDWLWANFLLVARALLQGYPLKAIPLFKDIAGRTIMALRG